ncbi:MAG: hypothetical protein AMJ79_09425 [Phycisphaerae bacterium SM23_30]|nr:MAG: hypothetical protein AMJ79_09425 [Phycisphaerae bacterium SM23_30]
MIKNIEGKCRQRVHVMTDYLEEYLRDEAPSIDTDHQNLQRNALKEVLRLTTEAVRPAETQIESTYHDAREKAQTGYNRNRKKIELRFETQKEAAQQQHQDRIEKIQAEYESDIKALEADAKIKRHRVISDAESLEQDAQKNHEYEVMLAENVADAALKRCQQDRQDIEEAVPAAKSRLDTLREHADDALRLYRQPLPSWEEVEVSDVGETDDVIATFRKQHELARQHLDALYALKKPRLFIGIWPYFFSLLLCGAAVGLTWLLSFQTQVFRRL